jgi:hypothetical protein
MNIFDFEKPDVLELAGVPAEMLTIGSTPDHTHTVLALSDGHSAWRVYMADKSQTQFLIHKLTARLAEMK